ncbi:MAG: HlyD family efflux transporter periplasmic adaptor subunit [Pirellulales bacterium]|nr:HlyD family efflux transporter periplasmic adaptor subunit [Pirellulales bacterium]
MWPLTCLALSVTLLAGCQAKQELRFGGYVEAEKIEVGSRVGGRIEEVFVEEGDEVQAGDVLVRFETVGMRAQLDEARSRVGRLQAELEKAVAGPRPQEIAQAREQYAAAGARLKRATNDHKRALERGERFTTKAELDELETLVQVAQNDERALGEQVAMLEEGTRAEDIIIARRALEEAQAHVVMLEDQLDEGVVKAPVDATVESSDLQPGDLVAGGAPLATLVRSDELWVRCFVPTTKITFVHPGQEVTVEVDSRPNELFKGRVLRVNRVAEYTPRNVQTFDQREDQVFGVKVRVEDPAGVLRPGMAATVLVPEDGGVTAAPAKPAPETPPSAQPAAESSAPASAVPSSEAAAPATVEEPTPAPSAIPAATP